MDKLKSAVFETLKKYLTWYSKVNYFNLFQYKIKADSFSFHRASSFEINFDPKILPFSSFKKT